MHFQATKLFLFISPFLAVFQLSGQDIDSTSQKVPPALKTNRAEENYSYLKNAADNPYQPAFGDALKYIALNQQRSIYVSVGGSYRARMEHFTNKDWTEVDLTYYSQRLTLDAAINFGENLRVFTELYHGYTSGEEQLLQSDVVDFHQAFVELKIYSKDQSRLNFRFGRQELAFGATRLVGNREGTNMRRSFDLAKMIYQKGKTTVLGFYGKEVSPKFDAFDNAISLFDEGAINPELWGLYLQFPIKQLLHNELYYMGFRSKLAGFSDVLGEEVRHTIGLRRFGTIGSRITFNTEFMYQFGDLDGSTISAFNIETDWKFKLATQHWKPTLGLKLDWSSGDQALDDGKVHTFNPMFVNPAIYSLAAVNTPANLTSLHPNFTFFPVDGLVIYLDYAFFYRTSREDGLYTPPRFQTRQAGGIESKHIGDTVGLSVGYAFNRNMDFNLMSSYFIPGKYIETSGSAESTFFIAPTLTFIF